MKLVVAGSRTFDDYDLLSKTIQSTNAFQAGGLEIVSGTARGADTLGEKFAEEFGLEVHRFPADWDTHGKSAGYRRNDQMAEFSDGVLAFWDNFSRGSMHMIKIGFEKRLRTAYVVRLTETVKIDDKLVVIDKMLDLPTVVNKRVSEFDEYIGRGSIWGNPFPMESEADREAVTRKHWNHFISNPELVSKIGQLEGKRLGCFCKPKMCHGDNYIDLFNRVNERKMIFLKGA